MHLEDKRQLFHASLGALLALVYYFLKPPWVTFSLLFILELIIFTLHYHYPLSLLSFLFGHLERKENLHKFPGLASLAFMLGCALATALYSNPIATASILILSLGDSSATFFGRRGSHPLFGRKTWEGLIAGIFFSTLAAQFIVPFFPALVASVITMTVETLDPRCILGIDDNLVIPVLSGAVLTLFL